MTHNDDSFSESQRDSCRSSQIGDAICEIDTNDMKKKVELVVSLLKKNEKSGRRVKLQKKSVIFFSIFFQIFLD